MVRGYSQGKPLFGWLRPVKRDSRKPIRAGVPVWFSVRVSSARLHGWIGRCRISGGKAAALETGPISQKRDLIVRYPSSIIQSEVEGRVSGLKIINYRELNWPPVFNITFSAKGDEDENKETCNSGRQQAS